MTYYNVTVAVWDYLEADSEAHAIEILTERLAVLGFDTYSSPNVGQLPRAFEQQISYLPNPATMRKQLRAGLPDWPNVVVIPRDTREVQCAAYWADHYEIAAYYHDQGRDLAELAASVAALRGVYRTTVVTAAGIEDPDWPVVSRPPRELLRPSVRALIRDHERPPLKAAGSGPYYGITTSDVSPTASARDAASAPPTPRTPADTEATPPSRSHSGPSPRP